MKGKLLSLAILSGLMLIIGFGTVRVSAAEPPAGYNYKFDIIKTDANAQVTVSGTPGTALTEQTVRIRLNGAYTVNPIAKGMDVTQWVICVNGSLPSGLKAKVAANADTGSAWIEVTFYGTTYMATWDEFYFRIPFYYLFEGGSPYDFYTVKPDMCGKFNVVRTGTSNPRLVTFSPEKLTINGTVNSALTGTNELKVTLNGVFLRSLNANMDVTDWFRGKGTVVNANGTIYSFLPAGVKVKVKTAVKQYSDSVTLVFYGTPTEASMDVISFTIPAGYAAIKNEGKNCETNAEFTTPIYQTLSSNCRYNISGPGGYLRQGLILELGDQHVNAMGAIDTNNPVLIHATLFGNDESGNPLTLYGDGAAYNGKNLGQVTWNATQGGLYEYYGITPIIRNWTHGGTSFDIELTGTPKEESSGSYPKRLFVSFELKSECHSGSANLKTESIGDLWLDEPKLNVSSDEYLISCPIDEAGNISTFITINLGDNKLTEDIPADTYLSTGFTIINGGLTQVLNPVTSYNGISFRTYTKANKNDNKIKVWVLGKPNKIGNCYIPIAFKCSQLSGFASAKAQQFVVGYTNVKYEVWSKENPVLPDDDDDNGGGGNGNNEEEDENDPRGKIRYPETEHVIIYAKAGSETAEDVYIDLTDEKLICGKDYACYSIDGGTKYKQGKLNDKAFEKLLNKEMTLCLATAYDSKTKAPAENATIYIFGTINKRPAVPKLKVEYLSCADTTGQTPGQFMLADKEMQPLTQADIQLLDIAVASSDGKKPDEKGYGKWPLQGGVWVPALSGTKVATNTYIVRTAPTSDTPASKAVKIKVKGQQKAPKVKIDYKKEIIKGKEKMNITCDGTALASDMTKEAAKTGIDLSSYLTAGSRAEVRVWIGATAKKAATAVQTINAAARAEAVTSGAITLTAGKIKLGKNFEAYNADKDKWGGLPKITDSCTILIRLKSTAKGGKESDTTYAASDAMKLVVTYGVTDAEKNKTGVISADVKIE